MRKGIEFNEKGFGRFGKEAYLRVKECGFDAVDFAMADTDAACYTLPLADAFAMMEQHKALADAAGVDIYQVHGPWRYPPRDLEPEDRAERLEKMKRSIRLAARLGAKNWVVHPIMPCTTEDLDNGREEETWQLNVTFMRELLKVAREEDVTICLENMPFLHLSISRPVDIMRLIREIDDDHFAGCLDTGHVAVYPDEDVSQAVHTFGDKLKIMHMHDNNGRQDEHKMPYYGVIDWEAYLSALRQIGFDGVLSLETLPAAGLPDKLFLEEAAFLAHILDDMIGV